MLLGTWALIVVLLALRWRAFYTASELPAAEDVTSTMAVVEAAASSSRHGSIQKY